MSAIRVLIVDDNEMNVELLSVLLDAAGFQVDTAADAGQALQRVAAAPPQLILMDIQMPGVDGLQLTRSLKADPATRLIPVVAVTAYAMKGDEAKMLEAGCDGYISKPIDVASFAQQVRAYVVQR